MSVQRSEPGVTSHEDSDSSREDVQNVQQERPVTSLICETPVTIFQESRTISDAPKRSVVYLCRMQSPPVEVFQFWNQIFTFSGHG